MNIYYYAWIRQKIAKNSDHIDLDKNTDTLEKLISIMVSREDIWGDIFNDTNSVRFAINGVITKDLNSKICNEDNISIFPPFTGG